MDNYHITPTENGWALKKQGAELNWPNEFGHINRAL